MTSKKTLIYIASDVRSGSTLLDYLLSNNDNIISIGEFALLNDHLNRKGWGVSWDWCCSCGQHLEDCSFWSKVITEYEMKTGQEMAEAETTSPPRRRAWSELLISLLIFLTPLKSLKRKFQQFFYYDSKHIDVVNHCLDISSCICEVTGKTVIVDSSKLPSRVFSFFASDQSEFSIKLIHLVRDARAVSLSKVNRYRQFDKKANYLSAMAGWLIVNLKLYNLRSYVSPEKYIRVQYEQLCENPRETILQICDHFKVPYDPDMAVLNKTDKHNIAGSQHRFEASTEIKLDQRWKSSMTFPKKLVYYSIGFVFNKVFGY